MRVPGPSNLREALLAMIAVAGGSRRVAFRLWPNKSPKQGASQINQILRENNRCKLDVDEWAELFRIGQEVGFHLPIETLCDRAGYSKPTPINTEQERAELQKQFLRVSSEIDGVVEAFGGKTFDEAFAEAEELDDPKWRLIYERRRESQRHRDELMAQVAERDGDKCADCESRDNLTLDHIMPISKGGTDDLDNLQILCRPCNLSKGAKVVEVNR